jgi:beta-mannosidase
MAPDGSIVSENPQLLAVPGLLAFPAADVTAQVAGAANADGSVNVTLASTATALFVTLTTAAQGRFAPNVFMMPGAGAKVAQFLPFAAAPLDLALLADTLRVDHVAAYSVHAATLTAAVTARRG